MHKICTITKIKNKNKLETDKGTKQREKYEQNERGYEAYTKFERTEPITKHMCKSWDSENM